MVYSFWKILKDKNIPFSHKILLIFYFFTKPKILLKVFSNIIRLFPFMKKIRFDLIIAGHSGWILPLVFILARLFNKKVVSIAYGLDFLVVYPLSFKTLYFRNTDKIILITKKTKELIKKIHHLDEKQLEVIYVGINFEELEVKKTKLELRSEFGISSDTFIILSVGRHIERKNFDLVIKAIHRIKQIRSKLKIKYFLIGEGPETMKLKDLTKRLNIENNVIFLGSCDRNTRNKFYKLSDIFIMPSLTKRSDIEGFGIVFLEANYFKLPVIGSATGGMVEAIIDKKTGYLISQGNIDQLVEKILYLYDNEAERRRIGVTGYRRAIEKFSWKNIINDYFKVFEKLLNT
ncbi:MAG: glycosyltransferase family 4 protein [Promethearchaeota archaeon]